MSERISDRGWGTMRKNGLSILAGSILTIAIAGIALSWIEKKFGLLSQIERCETSSELHSLLNTLHDGDSAKNLILNEVLVDQSFGEQGISRKKKCLTALKLLEEAGKIDDCRSDFFDFLCSVRGEDPNHEQRAFVLWVLIDFYGMISFLDEFLEELPHVSRAFLKSTIALTILGSINRMKYQGKYRDIFDEEDVKQTIRNCFEDIEFDKKHRCWSPKSK